MAIADRVKDTSTSTGTTDFTLSGTPPTGFQGLSAVGTTGTTFPYVIDNGAEWEVGTGTITGTNTFSRSPTVSSNSNALVNFSAGSKTVYVALSTNEYLNGVATFSNKRIKTRVLTMSAPSATPSFNTDSYDRISITALAVAITSFTVTGTPVIGDALVVDITDNGTARAIAWGTSFEPSTISLPTSTVAGQKLTVSFDWNPASSKWRCMGNA